MTQGRAADPGDRVEVGRPGLVDDAATDRIVGAIRQALTELSRNAPDFWNVVGLIELRGYEALAEQRLSNALPELLADYADLAGRMPGTPNWGSVLDQLRFLLYHLLLPGGKASAERAAAGKLVAAIEGFANAHA